MTHLPDPTSDLDWSGFVGPIHTHFRAHAERSPSSTCVIETLTSTSPQRRFTYSQIYHASNILAHHLHAAGITNGDVVMIWAHRSVDLVVCFMGILASGATMTVLDPAYPPQRQRIYLEVARPRALVRIGRATDENGVLAPVVQSYINESLELKADVPDLRLGDDGELSGGLVDGKDVFEGVRHLAASPPDVLVGPDSNPTLSFTSGSEGRPKGVLGRHYSLTRYFPWMSKRFHLTADSKFTMLSGIAHDPIQRDVFTPLFLGASLLVPSKEDIQHEKLAEWMREYQPTVTHLTPAMGQILVGGASAEFPSLQHAFFVGDVLTARDCRVLRRLGENVNIINLFGTTETQRAVSYYEVPSRAREPDALDKLGKETIPAGQGMENVQLLVINREDRNKTCAVGEVGELYVRAAGLAEKYLGDETLNEQKFLTNWFVDNEQWVTQDKKADKGEAWRKYYFGPRDRLYRSGDLGRYLPSGAVECTGRADDQVKIRGFRIELNEIDSNLSQSPLIRDCKTLINRDKFEEPTLVSYIVPQTAEWERWSTARNIEVPEDDGLQMGSVTVYLKKYRSMQTEIRDHLSARLPAYAVPNVYIAVSKLPLNPNGKVDKPALPFPDIADLTESASPEDLKNWEMLTATEKEVAEKWAELIRGLNAKSIRRENSLFELGGHSLLAQQLLLTVRRDMGVDMSINALYASPTLEGFAKEIERLRNPDSAALTNGHATEQEPSYSRSLTELIKTLPAEYQSADATELASRKPLTIFLTGATGFLGSFLVREILSRSHKTDIKLVAHVRGAKDPKLAFNRLQRSLRSQGLWQDSWASQITCVPGDLSQAKLGIDEQSWHSLAQEVDVVIHNGAAVHWVKRYEDMMASNVQSTIDAMSLCNEGKPKIFTYISSTAVLDTDHYIKLSDAETSTGQGAVLESDDMMGSRLSLTTGYGQTKWVSEQLIREAGRRHLSGAIVRPGYILGDPETGVSNTDDFLIRMLKGCIQLSSRPRIINTVNAVPVTHVARVVAAAALNPLIHPSPPTSATTNGTTTPANGTTNTASHDTTASTGGINVIHVTAHPRLRMSEYLSILEYFSYPTPEVPYTHWKSLLESFVSAGNPLQKDQEQHALMPLYHFCMNDLPANTRAPELDDRNAVAVLKSDAERWSADGADESGGYGIGREDVGRFLAYLVGVGYIAGPPVGARGRKLPVVEIKEEQRAAAGGRGGVQ